MSVARLTRSSRDAWVGGALVGAVVIVIGVGSGLGTITGRRTTSYQASGPPAGQAQAGVGVAVSGGGAGARSAPDLLASSAGVRGGSTGPSVATARAPSPAPSTAGAPASPGGAPAPVCAGKTALTAMSQPLVSHLDKAHLETSPGQQVADLLSLDQYVKTHTVLAKDMLKPIVDMVMAMPDGLVPLMTHLDKAHLETSPGQQVADLLAVDQYVKTHTVLAKDVLAPTLSAATAAGPCG